VLGLIVLATILSRDLPAQVDETKPSKAGHVVTNSLGMKFAYCPPGEFLMGSPEMEEGRYKDETQHRVTLTQGFYLGVYEVTVGQFTKFVVATKYRTDAERDPKGGWGLVRERVARQSPEFSWQNPGYRQTESHPLVNVSWNDAMAFCQWLSKQEVRTYRLPTESEWEYACRAGTSTAYQNGTDPESLALIANVRDASAKKHFGVVLEVHPFGNLPTLAASDGHPLAAPVGRFRPNSWGHYDLQGNVSEWCSDCYGDYPSGPAVNPTGADPQLAEHRVWRGGNWFSHWFDCRSAARVGYCLPTLSDDRMGFRVVLVSAP